jgi:hypothetical protein
MYSKKLILLIVLIIGTYCAKAQQKMEMAHLAPFEKTFLNIITRDTLHDFNLNILGTDFSFGIDTKDFNDIAIIKHKNLLLLQPLGTGRLFKVIKNEGNYQIQRKDSTNHSGVNFNAYTYLMKDTLFQLGGGGFWNVRGIITFYSQKTKQWELYNTNKEIPAYRSNVDFQAFKVSDREKKLYIFGKYYFNDFPKTLTLNIIDSCYSFDYENRSWSTLGLINPKLKARLNNSNDLNFASGDFISFSKELESFWINYSKNTFGKFKETKNNELKQEWLSFYPSTDANKRLIFYYGDSMFLCKIINNALVYKTIHLTEADLDLTNIDFVYSNSLDPIQIFNKYVSLYLPPSTVFAFLLFVLFFAIFLYKRRRKIPKEVVSILYHNFFSSLTIIEKELIEVLYKNHLKGEEVATKTINKIIGVQQKDTLTQNKSRSDHFIKINQKFKLATQQSEPLIIKSRDAADKRQYNYGLYNEYINEIEKLFKN